MGRFVMSTKQPRAFPSQILAWHGSERSTYTPCGHVGGWLALLGPTPPSALQLPGCAVRRRTDRVKGVPMRLCPEVGSDGLGVFRPAGEGGPLPTGVLRSRGEPHALRSSPSTDADDSSVPPAGRAMPVHLGALLPDPLPGHLAPAGSRRWPRRAGQGAARAPQAVLRPPATACGSRNTPGPWVPGRPLSAHAALSPCRGQRPSRYPGTDRSGKRVEIRDAGAARVPGESRHTRTAPTMRSATLRTAVHLLLERGQGR